MTEAETTQAATQPAEKQYRTRSLEVPNHKIDEFDTAIDNEKRRTEEALADAEYNRKKYGDAKNRIRELESQLREKDQTIEYKNTELARMRRADRGSREHEVQNNQQEVQLFNIVADRMLRKRA
jgi:chromosome segregation ATPase